MAFFCFREEERKKARVKKDTCIWTLSTTDENGEKFLGEKSPDTNFGMYL